MKHPERVRFWTKFEGQWRGIQLELEGDAVELHGGGPHEEGATWYAEVYTYEVMDCGTAVVRCEIGSWGRDCDGRHSYEWKGYALVSELEKVTTYAELGSPLDRIGERKGTDNVTTRRKLPGIRRQAKELRNYEIIDT